jgi:putative NADH-flavin reductase
MEEMMRGSEQALADPVAIVTGTPSVIARIGHTALSVLWVASWLILFRMLGGEHRTTILLSIVAYALFLSLALARAGYRSRSRRVLKEGPARNRPTRLLIVGATGGTGRHLVAQALERGYAVTALVRDPSKLRMDHERLNLVRGDVMDYDTIEAAMRGQEAVVSALGHKRFFYPTRIQSEGARNILRAMEAHHVSRFVCQTSLGLGDTAGRLGLYFTLFTIPVVLPFYFWDKARQERLIAESNAEWIIVRPGMLTNGARRRQFRHGFQIGNPLWTVRISRADVADFMLDQVTSDRYLRAAPAVAW